MMTQFVRFFGFCWESRVLAVNPPLVSEEISERLENLTENKREVSIVVHGILKHTQLVLLNLGFSTNSFFLKIFLERPH